MRVVLGLVSAALVAVSATAASADDWAIIGKTSDFSTAIDLASVAGAGQQKTVWTMRVYRQTTNDLDYVLIQREFDCSRRTAAVVGFAAYKENGDFVARSTDRGTADPVVPSSITALELDVACGTSSSLPGMFDDVRHAVEFIRRLQANE